MKPTEAAALLTIAAAFDNRKPDADQAKAWAMALDGLRFEDCRQVIVEHYRASRDWLMPSDVCAGVKRIRDQRIRDFGPLPAPPADSAKYAREIRETLRRIGDGELTPENVEPIEGHAERMAELIEGAFQEMPRDERMSAATARKSARAAARAAKHVAPTDEETGDE